jgi:hypothetical protein
MNFPKSSYFDRNFSTLSSIIKNQFAKMEENEFLIRNFNRILEMLSDLENNMATQLSKSLSSSLNNNTFQEFALRFSNASVTWIIIYRQIWRCFKPNFKTP